MTKASEHSHDNASASSVKPPPSHEIEQDIAAFEKLSAEVEQIQKDAEKRRPTMKL